MLNRHLTAALQAIAISAPLAALIGFAMREFSWRLAIVAAILFAIVWIVMVGRSKSNYSDAHSAPQDQTWIRGEPLRDSNAWISGRRHTNDSLDQGSDGANSD